MNEVMLRIITNNETVHVSAELCYTTLGVETFRRSPQGHAQRHGDVRYEEREVCSTVYERVEEERLTGYDVSYAYGGQTYKTRMRRDPGSTVRVRVQVEPI